MTFAAPGISQVVVSECFCSDRSQAKIQLCGIFILVPALKGGVHGVKPCSALPSL